MLIAIRCKKMRKNRLDKLEILMLITTFTKKNRLEDQFWPKMVQNSGLCEVVG